MPANTLIKGCLKIIFTLYTIMKSKYGYYCSFFVYIFLSVKFIFNQLLTVFLFELDQSNVLKGIRKLEPQLKDILPTKKSTTKSNIYKLWKKCKQCYLDLAHLLMLPNKRFQDLKINVNVKFIIVVEEEARCENVVDS